MDLKNVDFESRDVRHEGKRKLVPQLNATWADDPGL